MPPGLELKSTDKKTIITGMPSQVGDFEFKVFAYSKYFYEDLKITEDKEYSVNHASDFADFKIRVNEK